MPPIYSRVDAVAERTYWRPADRAADCVTSTLLRACGHEWISRSGVCATDRQTDRAVTRGAILPCRVRACPWHAGTRPQRARALYTRACMGSCGYEHPCKTHATRLLSVSGTFGSGDPSASSGIAASTACHHASALSQTFYGCLKWSLAAHSAAALTSWW
jgi:hypothetical protein